MAGRSQSTASRASRKPPRGAAAGIHTVYQDLSLCDNLDAVKNLFLGHEHTAAWWRGRPLRRQAMERRAHEVLDGMSVQLRSFTAPVGAMSGGQRQGIAICRALVSRPPSGHARRADGRAGCLPAARRCSTCPPAQGPAPRRAGHLARHEGRPACCRPCRGAPARHQGGRIRARRVLLHRTRRRDHRRARGTVTKIPSTGPRRGDRATDGARPAAERTPAGSSRIIGSFDERLHSVPVLVVLAGIWAVFY